MSSNPRRVEIDHHVIKLVIGVIAISLAGLTSLFSKDPLTSISASYHAGGPARDIFVGFLFAIFAFLLAYNGKSRFEMVLSKLAGFSALGVALFPCKCTGHLDEKVPEIFPYLKVHGIAAVAMFIMLAIFCGIFFRRARKKGHAQAKSRATIYALCGTTIVTSILILLIDGIPRGESSRGVISYALSTERLAFFGEAAGLIAFGIAWLTASCTLPIITSKTERYQLSPFPKAGEK